MSPLTQISHHVHSYFVVLGFPIYFYGVLMAAASLLIYLTAKQLAPKYDLNSQLIDDIFLWVAIPTIVGARLYHVLSELPYYLEHPLMAINLRSGGLGIFGALIGGFLGLWYTSHRYQFSFTKLASLIAPYLLLAQGIVRWGNFLNQEAFGPPTDSYLKIFIAPEHRPLYYQQYEYFHPTFFYESLLNFIGAGVLIFIQRKSNYRAPMFALYLITYGLIRIISESFRFDTGTFLGIKMAYLISIFSIIIGLTLYFYEKRRTA